jgi:protein bicaudal D
MAVLSFNPNTHVVSEFQQQTETLEDQRRQFKNDISEYKKRENRNLADYAELEEENITLQKTVSQFLV